MKGTVIVKFGCKNTKKVYEVGSEYEGSAERIAELVKKGKVDSKPMFEAEVKDGKITLIKEKVDVEKIKEKRETKHQAKKEK